MADLIFLHPTFHKKIWGGRRLATEFAYCIPDGPVGECWAISAHPSGDNRVAEGAYDGMRLSELWHMHPELFGEAAAKNRPFPLLIKILDAADDLSIQVHPDDTFAQEHEQGSLGKTECWYVLDCADNATIVVGQTASSPEEFRALARTESWDVLLNTVPIHRGDFFQIPAGTVHAIQAGTLILETQQSSDVTYRVYDYDRVQPDGKTRELHVEKSLACIDYTAALPASGKVKAPTVDGVCELVSCPAYTVFRLEVSGRKMWGPLPTFCCASVISGEGTASSCIASEGTASRGVVSSRTAPSGTASSGTAPSRTAPSHTVVKGSHFIVPANHGLELVGNMTVIISFVSTL